MPRLPEIVRARVSARQPRLARARRNAEIHVAIASLVRGGAERIALDTCGALARRGQRVHLIVLHRRAGEYSVPPGVRVSRIGKPPDLALDDVARGIARGGNRLVLAHLLRVRDLQVFWRRGVSTIPVIHNMSGRWLDAPGAYGSGHVPIVIAVAEAVAQELRERESSLPVGVVRHDLTGRTIRANAADREKLRSLMSLSPRTLLIGMIGNFQLHKGYPRALRVLAEVLRVRDARLAIAGGAANHEGRTALQATRAQTKRLGLENFVLFTGEIPSVEPLLAAFDVFLNTSLFEGLSVAALEARAAGLPLVLSAVGGQSELSGPNVTLLPPPFEPRQYAEAVIRASGAARQALATPALSHRLWALYGRRIRVPRASRLRVLFVTANLNAGGAQRSLFNLLRDLPADIRAELCVTHASTSSYFLDRLRRAGVPVFRPCDSSNPFDIAEALLDTNAAGLPQLVCFWNADPKLKLLLAKVLAHVPAGIVDVSPGPAMYHEMEAVAEFQQAIAYSAAQYFARLDALVVKYAAGVQEAQARTQSTRIELIPNGVAVPLRRPSGPRAPRLITAGRIAPAKHLEILLDAMRRIWAAHPECELHIAGQAEPRFHEWFERLWARARRDRRVRLLGPLPHFPSLVSGYTALMLASDQQGCPNTSLEALAAGVPVIANDDGGTCEQVIDGKTGFLLPRPEADLYAERALRLLRDPALRTRLGASGRVHVTENFPLQSMRERYFALMRGLVPFARRTRSLGIRPRM